MPNSLKDRTRATRLRHVLRNGGLEELAFALEWQRAEEVFSRHEYQYDPDWQLISYRLHKKRGQRHISVYVVKLVPRACDGAPYKQYLRIQATLPLDEEGYATIKTSKGIAIGGVCVPGDLPHFCGIATESEFDHEPQPVRQVVLPDQETGAGGPEQSDPRPEIQGPGA